MKKILLISIAIFAFTAGIFAQSATATASAVIVGPISLNRVSDMDFGNIAVTGTAGDVILTVTGSRLAPTGPALVAPANGTPAEFSVSGEGGREFSITLPDDGEVSLTGPGAPMLVKDFNHSLTGTLEIPASGTINFRVGATLTVAYDQAAGSYSSSPFTVTVNYN